jgi:membrane peptidoglycan carboxypeptidase
LLSGFARIGGWAVVQLRNTSADPVSALGNGCVGRGHAPGDVDSQPVARASGLSILSKLAKLAALIAIVGVLAAGVLLPYVGGAGLIAKVGADKFLDTSCTLKEEPVQQKTTVYASDGRTPIATLFDQNRSVVSLRQVPKAVTNALISTEDRRFYQHHGVDIRGLMRAALHTSNGNTQGASTLTEQYVKQVRYYQARTPAEQQAAIAQNIDRKISDAQCALQIERKYTKKQILEKYLNIAFFGENSYGIQTAAQTFFGEDVSKLTVPQAALLIGLVKSPSQLDPYVNPQDARDRRDLVISNMADQAYITPAQAASAKASPIKLARLSSPPRGCAYANPAIRNAGFFCDYATEWLRDVGGLSDQVVNTGGLKIVTTLDKDLQNSGQDAIWRSGLDPRSDYLLALPSIDPRSGAVTTMITSKHYGAKKGDPAFTEGRLFTDAYAGSGSTYKYFTALAALKAGVPAGYTLTAPSPYTIKNCPNDPANPYRPENAGSYRPTLPLNQALPESSNTYFVAMEDQFFGCDLAPIVNTATSLGMNYLKNHKVSAKSTLAQQIIADRRATFTLGQEPTPALELTSAFGAVANDGVYCPPTPIKAITNPAGQAVKFSRPGCTRAFDSYVARTLVNIMTADTAGGGTAQGYFGNWYGNGGSPVAGKTGTNNSAVCDSTGNNCVDDKRNSALWFVGITPQFVSTAALVNPVHPNQPISNVPGVTAGNDGTDTFGAFGATFWLDAFQNHLIHQQWSWQTADSTPGDRVQLQVGTDVATAQSSLAASGYKSTVLKSTCGSSITSGNVAFFSPAIAPPGATISLCLSSGRAPDLFIPPTRPFRPGNSSTPPGRSNSPSPKPTRSSR